MYYTKAVLIIGNGPSVLENRWGWRIDNFVGWVVRINDFKISGFEPWVGSRVDRYMAGWDSWHRYRIHRELRDILIKIPSHYKQDTRHPSTGCIGAEYMADLGFLVYVHGMDGYEKGKKAYYYSRMVLQTHPRHSRDAEIWEELVGEGKVRYLGRGV